MRFSGSDEYQLHTTAGRKVGQQGRALALKEDPISPGTHEHRTVDALPAQHIRVLIVDDHTLIREGLSQLFALEEDLQVVGEAADGFAALQQIEQKRPDVVLMDINLPVMDGIATTRQIVERFPQVAVVMLTMHRQHVQIVEAMRSGARGYLLKSVSAREVAQAMRIVHAGGVAITPSLTGALVNEVRQVGQVRQVHQVHLAHRQSDMAQGESLVAQLSEKEIELIRYLATGRSNKEIAEQLAYSEKTVKNYLSIIFQKLHLRDRTQVAIFALRHGLLPEEDL